ncbi:hypothetical protein [Actinacidiphila alni]|uniref:hypothetical protein n=1 Tax=Actinacidiphila alni TaxID=380248 RepID=UPI0034553BE6
MARTLTAAQRKAVTGSDPATGRLSARADVCAALAAAGLAVRHGRSGHHGYYLSEEGLRQRAALAAAGAARQAADEASPPAASAAPGGAFTADDGTGTAAADRGPGRTAEVAAAWEGLIGIRAVLLDGVTDVPAPWERERLVHAVALALEAAGCPPGGGPDASGYAVALSGQQGAAEVSWRGAESAGAAAGSLARCAVLLEARGWQCTRHRDRAGRPFLLVSPRRKA